MGAWFLSSQGVAVGGPHRNHTGPRYRFYRLAPNRRFLHFLGANERRPVRPGLDDLPDKSESAGMLFVMCEICISVLTLVIQSIFQS